MVFVRIDSLDRCYQLVLAGMTELSMKLPKCLRQLLWVRPHASSDGCVNQAQLLIVITPSVTIVVKLVLLPHVVDQHVHLASPRLHIDSNLTDLASIN